MWLCKDKDCSEWQSINKPIREVDDWFIDGECWLVANGTIERLLNYPLTWDDEAEYIEGW